jgi:hypothetical protein
MCSRTKKKLFQMETNVKCFYLAFFHSSVYENNVHNFYKMYNFFQKINNLDRNCSLRNEINIYFRKCVLRSKKSVNHQKVETGKILLYSVSVRVLDINKIFLVLCGLVLPKRGEIN